MPSSRPAVLFQLFVAIALLGACSGNTQYDYPQPVPGTDDKWASPSTINSSSVFGDSGIFGSGRRGSEQGGGIGVNALLWRSSLDTISFMPLVSADPFGGVILSDWYSTPETPNERFKMHLFITGRELRADGVRVSVFRQRRESQDQWIDAPVDPQTAIGIENAVLTRARQLRSENR